MYQSQLRIGFTYHKSLSYLFVIELFSTLTGHPFVRLKHVK